MTISFLNLEFYFVSILLVKWKYKILPTENNMLFLATALEQEEL